jgi:uncharacterized protein (DUF427 family)
MRRSSSKETGTSGRPRSRAPWKSTASYDTLAVGEKEHRDAAWFHPEPKAAAQQIAGRVAFWKDVEVTP